MFRYPTPLVQSIGLVSVPITDSKTAGWIERKPVAAAVLTLSQREDGHVSIFHEVMSAIDENQFPLSWLLEQELVRGAPTLVGIGDLDILVADAAQQRHFVERKLAELATGDTVIDVTAVSTLGIGEDALCRRLNIPRHDIDTAEATRVWRWFPRDVRIATLGEHALADALSRMMLWANLQATLLVEPAWFYETMLALRCWIDEREQDAPAIYRWGTCRPIMRAVSFAEEYRRDLARRTAGEDSDWPQFATGLFHT